MEAEKNNLHRNPASVTFDIVHHTNVYFFCILLYFVFFEIQVSGTDTVSKTGIMQ